MMSNYPDTFPIELDDYHAKHIGKFADGKQFFLTTPFVPAYGSTAGCEFVALFIFSSEGSFIDAKIETLGPRDQLDREKASKIYDNILESLGDVEFQSIKVSPFEYESDGTTFGLIPQELEDDEDEPMIELQPGNYMAFYPPWDGLYDT